MQLARTGIDQRLVWDLHRKGIVYTLPKIAGFTTGEDMKKTKTIQFFEVLGQLPLPPQRASEEIASMYVVYRWFPMSLKVIKDVWWNLD